MGEQFATTAFDFIEPAYQDSRIPRAEAKQDVIDELKSLVELLEAVFIIVDWEQLAGPLPRVATCATPNDDDAILAAKVNACNSASPSAASQSVMDEHASTEVSSVEINVTDEIDALAQLHGLLNPRGSATPVAFHSMSSDVRT